MNQSDSILSFLINRIINIMLVQLIYDHTLTLLNQIMLIIITSTITTIII